MDISIYFQAASVFGITLLFHKVIGEYPEKLENLREKNKELREALVVWIIQFLVVTWVVITGWYFPFAFPGVKIFEGITISVNLITSFILPIIFLRLWKKSQERKSLGFNYPIDYKSTSLYILVYLIFAFITFLVTGGGEENILVLLWGIITPSLSEELVSRATITSKLERSLGIKEAWIVGGILFGLIHIPNDFFGYFWYLSGQNFIIAFGGLLVQIGMGWMLSITYIKTRSLIPCVIAHYIVDFFPVIFSMIIPL